MAGGSYELPDSVVIPQSPEAELIINQILQFLRIMLGEGEDSGDTIKYYLGVVGGDSYWEFDKVNFTYKLYLNGTQYRGYNE